MTPDVQTCLQGQVLAPGLLPLRHNSVPGFQFDDGRWPNGCCGVRVPGALHLAMVTMAVGQIGSFVVFGDQMLCLRSFRQRRYSS